MKPKASAKTKAQDLQRIRTNQQRSRDRKRAYVVELEEKVRLLNERLQSRETDSPASSTASWKIVQENDAREELLKALGIDESVQRQFIDAFARRAEVKRMVDELRPESVDASSGKDPKADTSTCSTSPDQTGTDWQCGEISDATRRDCCNNTRTCRRQEGDQQNSAWLPLDRHVRAEHATAAVESGGFLEGHHETPHPPPCRMPCSTQANLQINAAFPESTTGCQLAFSMLLANNNRGWNLADIETRLQAAYRKDDSVGEGCSVLNKVLFQLLSEIS